MACVLTAVRVPTAGSVQVVPSRLATMNVSCSAPASTSAATNVNVASYVSKSTPAFVIVQ